MAQQKKINTKEEPTNKKPEEKKHFINPRYQNTVWTIVIVVVLTIFFIVNNTKSVQERGPYPPNYNSPKGEISKQLIDSRISFIIEDKDTSSKK
jgi:hypothetical protein